MESETRHAGVRPVIIKKVSPGERVRFKLPDYSITEGIVQEVMGSGRYARVSKTIPRDPSIWDSWVDMTSDEVEIMPGCDP